MLIWMGKANLKLKDIKCLRKEHIASRCLNQKVMLPKDNEEVKSKSDKYESEEMPALKDCSDDEIAYSVEREALIIRHVLNMQIKKDDVDQQ